MTNEEAVANALPIADYGTRSEMDAAKRRVELQLGIEPSIHIDAFRAHHSYSYPYRKGGKPYEFVEELTDYANVVSTRFDRKSCESAAAA